MHYSDEGLQIKFKIDNILKISFLNFFAFFQSIKILQ